MVFQQYKHARATGALRRRRMAHLAACGVMDSDGGTIHPVREGKETEDDVDCDADGRDQGDVVYGRDWRGGTFDELKSRTYSALRCITQRCTRRCFPSESWNATERNGALIAMGILAFAIFIGYPRTGPEPVVIEARPWSVPHPRCSMCIGAGLNSFAVVPRDPGETHDLLVFCTGGESEIERLPGHSLSFVPRSCHVTPIGKVENFILPAKGALTAVVDFGFGRRREKIPTQYYVDVAWNESSSLAGRLVFVANQALAVEMLSDLKFRQAMADRA